MEIVNLASGSKMNSTLIMTSKHNILLDVGGSLKSIENKLLMSEGLDMNDISLVLISHFHS
jgi:metal-dependent hydrolase (beta-lactamase superfamily II)